MGALDVELPGGEREARAFTRAVLRDVEALEALVAAGALEAGTGRTGLEQEFYLVGADGRPRPCGPEVLARLADPRFTTELARFSLEVNFPPRPLAAGLFEAMEADVRDAVRTASEAAAAFDARVLLTGILPTLRAGDLGRESLTPERRYAQLNEAILRAHGPITVVIDGIEQFEGTYDSVALEGVNTSLQLHLQVDPAHSGALYNLAQLISAPLLASATNSPVLLGRRVWHETRVAVFERALDARSDAQRDRGSLSRVTFGDAWVGDSLVELFHDNLARFPVLLTRALEGDALEQVARGEVPALDALALHNGTVWRWNRACYGVLDGRPHLRIECRVLPAGPTVLDEMANAALFYGLMLGLAEEAASIPGRLAFDDARANFLAAARHGLEAEFTWLDGRTVGARALLEETLLPAARRGLVDAGIPDPEIERYLGTVAARVRAGRTGSQWLLDVYHAERGRPPEEIWRGAVAAMLARQLGETPVPAWPDVPADAPAEPGEPTVGQIMTSKVFAVRPDDVLDLATRVMEWKHIRHVPVESEDGQLRGLVTARDLIRLRDRLGDDGGDPVAVSEVMRTDLVTVRASMPLREAMQVITQADGGCLLVVEEGRLRGIVTDRDLVVAATRLLNRGDPPA
jgi:CBS domain-containing protein